MENTTYLELWKNVKLLVNYFSLLELDILEDIKSSNIHIEYQGHPICSLGVVNGKVGMRNTNHSTSVIIEDSKLELYNQPILNNELDKIFNYK